MIHRVRTYISNLSTTKRTILKNSAWLSVAEIGARIARGGLAIIAARILGASGLGVFAYAIALGGFLTFFEEAGINIFVTREFAKSPERRHVIFRTALILKISLLAIAIIGFLTIGPAISSIPEARLIIPVVALVLIFDSLRGFFFSISRAEQQMHLESKVQLLTNTLIVIFGLGFLAISPTPLSLAAGYALGGGIGCVAIFWLVKKYIPWQRNSFSPGLLREIFMAAWPFTILAVSNVLIFNTDTLFLGHYGTSTQVGLYGAASRLIQMFYILPSLFAATTFPILVIKGTDPEALRIALRKSLWLMGGVALFLTIPILIAPTFIITLVFGNEFAGAGLMFALLALTYLPVFIGSVLNNAIFALDRQRQFVIANILGVAVNIVLDIILIPHYQGVGAAIASVVGLSVIALVTAIKMRKLG